MITATLTSKGQLTIPKAVRDSLRLHAGDRVAFVVHGDDEAVLHAAEVASAVCGWGPSQGGLQESAWRRASAAILGLALPRLKRMTWPTR